MFPLQNLIENSKWSKTHLEVKLEMIHVVHKKFMLNDKY